MTFTKIESGAVAPGAIAENDLAIDVYTAAESDAALALKANASSLGTLASLSTIGTTNVTDGAITAAKLAAGVAAANLGFTPQAALGFSPLNPGNNLSDLGSAGSARNNIGLPVWDSGWYSVAKDSSYTKTHNLGSDKLLILTYFSFNASSAAFVVFVSFHSASHSYTGGCVIADINSSTFIVRTGANDCAGPSPYPNTDTMRFGGVDHLTSGGITGYYRNIAIRLG